MNLHIYEVWFLISSVRKSPETLWLALKHFVHVSKYDNIPCKHRALASIHINLDKYKAWGNYATGTPSFLVFEKEH